jgi:hypothetical protein
MISASTVSCPPLNLNFLGFGKLVIEPSNLISNSDILFHFRSRRTSSASVTVMTTFFRTRPCPLFLSFFDVVFCVDGESYPQG